MSLQFSSCLLSSVHEPIAVILRVCISLRISMCEIANQYLFPLALNMKEEVPCFWMVNICTIYYILNILTELLASKQWTKEVIQTIQ